jgi:hypothetical protein
LLLIVARFLQLRMLGVVFFQKRMLPRTWNRNLYGINFGELKHPCRTGLGGNLFFQ